MTNRWSKAFFIDLGERVASVAVYGAITGGVITKTTPLHGDLIWPMIVFPALMSLLKGIGANLVSPASGPSLVPAPPGPVEVNRGARKSDYGYGELGLVIGVLLVVILVVVLLRVL